MYHEMSNYVWASNLVFQFRLDAYVRRSSSLSCYLNLLLYGMDRAIPKISCNDVS